ncbi:MAG: HD domain-containing protein [archaeon]
MEKENLEKIFDFVHVIKDLKKAMRYSNIPKLEHRDSVADHSWRLAFMTFIIADELNLNIDTYKAVKIAIVHDLAEALTGDIDATLIARGDVTKEEKEKMEFEAMNKLINMLPKNIGDEVYLLWEEYENASSKEALFIKALDKIECISHIIENKWTKINHDHYKIDVYKFITGYADKQVKAFPELKEVLDVVKKRLKREFEKGNIEWKPEYDFWKNEIEDVEVRKEINDNKITSMKDAQELVKEFAVRNNWKDVPNVDKFDHLHEELIEMSQHLRYKNEEERIKIINEKKDIFKDGIGDLFFGTCRLANQLGVDIEDAFNMVKGKIISKYDNKDKESNYVWGRDKSSKIIERLNVDDKINYFHNKLD